MEKITIKQLKNYFKNDLKMECRHDFKGLKYALNKLNKETNVDVFLLVYLIFENRPIDSLHTHSYGFHTANGRHIVHTFERLYYKGVE